MRFLSIIKLIFIFVLGITFLSCSSDVKREPNSTYMPDMYYSRAYETYSPTDYLREQGINFTATPVVGTVKRGDMLPKYNLTNDEKGYAESAKTVNPIKDLTDKEKGEAERLYLINCGICHGAKLDGNGPLYKNGEGPYPAKPATLVGDVKYEQMPEGTIFHAIQYGKNLMGSYASQLNTKEAWMVVRYIKDKQTKK